MSKLLNIDTGEKLTNKELNFINHLRGAFQSNNPNLLLGYYDNYIPLSLVIVYIVKISNKTKHDLSEKLFVECLINEYLGINEIIESLILSDTLVLMKPGKRITPYKTVVIKKHIKKLNNPNSKLNALLKNTTDNYFSILASLVSFDSLIDSFGQIQGLSKSDSRIKAIKVLKECANNPEKLKHYYFQHDDIFYYYKESKAVSNKIKETTTQKTKDNVIINKQPKPKGKRQLEREALLKSYLVNRREWSIPVLLKTKDSYKDKNIKTNADLWKILNSLNATLCKKEFKKRSVDGFFDIQELCTFDEGKFKRINANR